MMATLNQFTANAIVNGIKQHIQNDVNYTMYVSGGGLHNNFLMENISKLLPNITIKSSLDIGLQPDAKEAILFALLANECIAGEPMFAGGNATKIPVSMGKISFPY
jgi:anhydro-N-acetylmuramic acid kinase